MKRQHRHWHRLIWCLMVPVLTAMLLPGIWFKPAPLVNTSLPAALQNAAIENTSLENAAQGAAPTKKTN
jgi:hypothetical protein